MSPCQKTDHPTKGLQCQWDSQLKRRYSSIHRPKSMHRREENQHEVFYHQPRSLKNDPGISMVHCHATKDRLG